ncbi:hypothetical protein NFI96_019117, partial [Prochilodus magdalenae]
MFDVCVLLRVLTTESSQRIQAVFTSASAGLEGFKAHAVFQEIAKKLQESCVVQPSDNGAALTGRLMEDTTARWGSVMVAVGSVRCASKTCTNNLSSFELWYEGDQFVKKIGGVFAFKVKDGPEGSEAVWIVDVKEGKGSVHNDTSKKADCTIAMTDSDLLALMTGKMNPQT